MTVLARELPLAIVACCTEYIVSAIHPVPECHHCGLTPQWVRDTLWYLGLDYE